MAEITLGRKEPNKTSVGGLRAVYFVPFGTLGDITYATTEADMAIVGFSGDPINAYKYELKGVNTFDETITPSRDAGTTFTEQVAKLQLKKITSAMHIQLRAITENRYHLIVEDNNGNFNIAGLERGCETTTSNIARGTVLGDHSGYIIEIKGEERVAANLITVSLSSAGFTVTEGV